MTEVYSIDLDEEILSHLSIPESQIVLYEDLKLELIEDDFTAEVFQWVVKHKKEHKRFPTPSVIADEFELEFDEPLTVVDDLIERLNLRFVQNNVRSYMERLSGAYKEDPALVVDEIQNVARDIKSILVVKEDAMGTGDFDKAIARYDEALLKPSKGSFGFKEVDDHFHKMRGISFCIAAPKTYKSWVTINGVVENIIQGNSVYLYPLELPADETDMRVRCLAAGVPYWKYLRGSLSMDDRKILEKASEMLDSMGTYKCIKPPSGHRSIEEMVERAGEAGADSVWIDQLQYVETARGKQLGAGDHTHYWEALNAARDLSDDMPMWIVHQFNRSVMGADRMPEMQQAKGAAAIEEVATLALGLWANRDMRKSGIIELGTLASRNYTFKSWEIGLDLTRTCDFKLIGEVEHDE